MGNIIILNDRQKEMSNNCIFLNDMIFINKSVLSEFENLIIQVTKNKNNLKLKFFDNRVKIGKANLCNDWDGSKNTFLYNFEIKEELCGQGYGTKIMRFLISECKIKALNVTKDNKVAIKLYEKFGFRITQNVNINGEAMLRMERKIVE